MGALLLVEDRGFLPLREAGEVGAAAFLRRLGLCLAGEEDEVKTSLELPVYDLVTGISTIGLRALRNS